jgi:murein peptide amidase A
LQADLTASAFHGIISLHTDKDSDGLYGVARGAVIARELLKPALAAAESFVPQSTRRCIAGFQAEDGCINDWFKGTLSVSTRTRPRPFEIALAIPTYPPAYLRQLGLVTALQTILAEYRAFISHAANL